MHNVAWAGLTVLAVVVSVIGLSLGSPQTGRSVAATTQAPASPTTVSDTDAAATGNLAPTPAALPTSEPEPVRFRNVVMILADDMDWDLFNQVPRLAALKAQGTTFANHVVTDSLCCPSRVSILRSQYVHNHLVISNVAASGGGYPKFRALGEENDCLPVWLDRAGSSNAISGKYLNEFPDTAPKRFVPPGWDEFVVPLGDKVSYTGYNYTLNDNGKLRRFGDTPKDFLNDVLDQRAAAFIRTRTGPFFALVSTMAPHSPHPTAERHRSKHRNVIAPRTPTYNAADPARPSWQRGFVALGPKRLARLDARWAERLRSAESVADSVDSVLAALRASGNADDTLVIVTSDNGYHVASRQMPFGKRTPYQEDTVVPFIAIGAGIPAGRVVTAMTSTIDIAPTIGELMGAAIPTWTDGRSLVPFLGGGEPARWRTGILTESLGSSAPGDPDFQQWNPPRFAALRTPDTLFIRYVTGEEELYDRASDPFESRNVLASADPARLELLRTQLTALEQCNGDSCRIADELPNAVPAAAPVAEPTN